MRSIFHTLLPLALVATSALTVTQAAAFDQSVQTTDAANYETDIVPAQNDYLRSSEGGGILAYNGPDQSLVSKTVCGAFVASIAAIAITFSGLRTERDVYWTMPLLGFTVWSVLAGYAIYFPELDPTRLRSSGTGLCYNVARYLTAGGVMILGRLVETFRDRGYAQPLRPAAIALSAVYLVGLAALVVLPETKGEALPE